MKAQQLVQRMVPRVCCLGASGIHQTNSVYSSDSQLLLSRPSVSGACLRSTQEKQLLGYQYVAAVFFNIGISCVYYFQYVAADVFSFFWSQLYCF